MLISDDEYKTFETWMREYIEHHCIIRTGRDIDYVMPSRKSGSCDTWQFYLRRGLFDPIFLSILSQMLIYKVEREIGHFNFQLSGLETAATPMLASIPLVSKGFGINLNSFVVRKEQKTYGIKNWIEGRPDKNKPVMLIDDICVTATAIKKAKWICEQSNLEVMKVIFVIINFENYIKQISNTKVIHLFNCDDWALY